MSDIAISENATARMIHDEEKNGRNPFPDGREGSRGCSEPEPSFEDELLMSKDTWRVEG